MTINEEDFESEDIKLTEEEQDRISEIDTEKLDNALYHISNIESLLSSSFEGSSPIKEKFEKLSKLADKVVDQDQTEYAKDMFETAEELDNILYEVTSKLDEAKNLVSEIVSIFPESIYDSYES